MVEAKIVNVAGHLSERAKTNPYALALKVPFDQVGGTIFYETYNFSQLESLTNGVAWHLIEEGVTRRSKVLVMVKAGLELILITFALFKIGAIPVVIDPGMGVKEFLKCVKNTKPDSVVGIPLAIRLSRCFWWAFRGLKIRIAVQAKPFLKTAKLKVNEFPVAPTRSDEIAAILFTSGSTGPAKGVVYQHGMFEAQIESMRVQYDIKPGEVDLSMLPIFALFNPALGMTTIVPQINPSRPAEADPWKIVQAITQNNVTTSFGSPVLWTKIVTYCETKGITLLTMRRILMGGTAVPPALIARCREVFPKAEVYTPYGATEALPVCSISGTEVLEKTIQLTESGKGLCVGRPLSSVKLKIIPIVDDAISNIKSCTFMPVGQVGEIIVKGPVVTEGYFDAKEATQLAKIVDDDGLWHRMGDLGYIDSEGRVWVCGRKVEHLSTSFGKIYTDCCEAIMNKHPQVYRSALIGVGEYGSQQPVLLIQPIAGAYPVSRIARQYFLQEMKIFAKKHTEIAYVEHFYLEKEFPVDIRHNAKIHRLTLKRKYNKIVK